MTKDGAFWVVNGTRKIPEKVFSTCVWVEPTTSETRIILRTSETNTKTEVPASVEVQTPSPQVEPQPPQAVVGVKPMENAEISEIETLLKYAGDNVWLVAAVFAFVLGKKYLDNKEKTDMKLKQDLSQQCGDRHTDVIKAVANIETQIKEVRQNVGETKVGLEHRLAAIEVDTKMMKKKLKEKSEKKEDSSTKEL